MSKTEVRDWSRAESSSIGTDREHVNGQRVASSFPRAVHRTAGFAISGAICYHFNRMNTRIDDFMERNPHRRIITSRIIRPGQTAPAEPGWEGSTPEERINAVWDLTLVCLAWIGDPASEPRLQRSVSRVQRPRR